METRLLGCVADCGERAARAAQKEVGQGRPKSTASHPFSAATNRALYVPAESVYEALMPALPAFALHDRSAQTRTFPSRRPALLCFVKHDCPTCTLSAPLIELAQQDFGDLVDVWVISQDDDAGAAFAQRFRLDVPILDDAKLAVSFQYGLDTVPTIILADGDGNELGRCVGFGKQDWRMLFSELARLTRRTPPLVDWSDYPTSRPGCGSRSVQPGISERLEAEASGSPLRARRIDIADADDPFEFLFDQGLTDGLPVIPPTPERVLRMLSSTSRPAQDVVALVPPNLAPATVENCHQRRHGRLQAGVSTGDHRRDRRGMH